jgi:hypothetical protein
MIFGDMEAEADKWRKYDYTLSKDTWAGSSFWFNAEVLRELCRFMYEIYLFKDSEKSKEIFSHYDKRIAQGLTGGVCDMTLCEHFRNSYDFKCGDTDVVVDGSVIDHNALVKDDYEHDGYSKSFHWINGAPYCYNRKFGNIRFNTIHLSQHRNVAGDYGKKFLQGYTGK